ncbi:MAG: XRE family transcriptional regulator [Gammaproteobacteria bacterium]|nr:XRE family transcriptional regulator [Gammaproteobacteria bacterium]
MIYNERQYKITAKQIEKLQTVLEEYDQHATPDWLAIAQKDALKSQITDLNAQLVEYNLIKEGKIRYSECSDLSNLPRVLIQARIGKGLSQKELADKLGMTAQQIQRYEASEYMGASLARLIEVSHILEVKLNEAWEGSKFTSEDTVFVWQDADAIDWTKFPIKEMIKKGWLSLKHKESPISAVKEFFMASAGTQYATALHRKKFHGANRPNEYALLAWQARVLQKARNEVEKFNIDEFVYDDSWLDQLVKLSTKSDSPKKVKDFLASKGIILVIEEHLQGTYLDGAAMLLETGNPVIALTLRYDRLDNFWFVLMHELGHIFLHLFDSLNMDFFDEENNEEEDSLEKEADEFALNTLIPDEKWELCLSRFSMSEESVKLDAQTLVVHPSIVAGRIRKESNNYLILNKLVGQGEVRKYLGN